MPPFPLEGVHLRPFILRLAVVAFVGGSCLLLWSTTNRYGTGAVFLILAGLYSATPYIIHSSLTIQRHLIFMHRVRWPHISTSSSSSYYNPSKYGLKGGTNFYIHTQSGNRIGVWHLLPTNLLTEYGNDEPSTPLKKMRDEPTIIYFHGNGGTRATGHRLELYKLLQSLNYHVIAFDYAGFADSTPLLPSKSSTLEDGLAVYEWVAAAAVGPVLFWGHSLGVGIATLVASTLLSSNSTARIAGLILESPYTSLGEVVASHPLVRLFPLHSTSTLFTSRLVDYDLDYNPQNSLASLRRLPLQLLHSVNDPVIGYGHCTRLVEGLRGECNWRLESFEEFGAMEAHVHICRSVRLRSVVREFVEECVSIVMTSPIKIFTPEK